MHFISTIILRDLNSDTFIVTILLKISHKQENELTDFKLHIPERMNAAVIARKIIEN